MMKVLIVAITLLTAIRPCSAQENAEDNAGYLRGKAEAQRDIQSGTVKVKTYGLAGSWITTYGRLLKDRHGINLDTVAGCCVTHELVDEVRGYNEISEAFIVKAHGTNFLSSVQDASQKLHDREYSIKKAHLLGLSSGKGGENEFVIQMHNRGLFTCEIGDDICGFTVMTYDQKQKALLVQDPVSSNMFWITSDKDKSRTLP
jgi:hypothetical protein